ncbi:MAG TPA: caspase family protein [Acidimicrobiales bacterium]|nr:caspase family protein [Acidimicrobiales bacterium]
MAAGLAVTVASVVTFDAPPFLAASAPAEVKGVVHHRDGRRGEPPRLREAPTADAAAPEASPEVVAPNESALAPPPALFDGPPAPAPPPPRALAEYAGVLPSPGTWAVLVGINDYPGSRSDLRSAIADIDDVDRMLAASGVPETNRLVLRDGQATADAMRRSIDWLRAHAGRDAVAVFFYAGHIRKVDRTGEAMIGADGGLLPDVELSSLLAGVAARRGWIGMAGCYGGGFTEALRPGWVLTAAADADSIAYENERLGRSYLVEYMVRRAMLERRADGSVEAAFAWARQEIERDYPNRVPLQIDTDPAVLDLRMAPPPVPARPSAPAPSPAAAPAREPASTPAAPPPPPPPAPPPPADSPPPEPDPCAGLTLGLLRCGG